MHNTIAEIGEKLRSVLHVMSKDIISIQGRKKSTSSIKRKIKSMQCSPKEINDIFGIRVILSKEIICYQALEIIKNKYELINVKDYIRSPKKNGYQSLHLVIVDSNKKKIEIQIRTKQMHANAENGTASHAKYKRLRYGGK